MYFPVFEQSFMLYLFILVFVGAFYAGKLIRYSIDVICLVIAVSVPYLDHLQKWYINEIVTINPANKMIK